MTYDRVIEVIQLVVDGVVALAWPALVLTAILIFRTQIAELLRQNVDLKFREWQIRLEATAARSQKSRVIPPLRNRRRLRLSREPLTPSP